MRLDRLERCRGCYRRDRVALRSSDFHRRRAARESYLIARHLAAREVRNYLNEAPLRDLQDPATPEPVATSEDGRSDQRFTLDARAWNGAEERRVTASGRDIYAVSAPIVVEAVERICTDPLERGGSFALGQLVDAAAFLQGLATIGSIDFSAPQALAPPGATMRSHA
jgi:hypothetical protein